ncbi:transposase [Nonomuraea sp. SYSU D8015]|uniref:transposase n=1 Tax=Nonomuraea sp. SYSU D8015 TaxID=2593644 RepID=UPI0016617AF2|nr:transposase [Nonomuraea sp. SYSU D8015]
MERRWVGLDGYEVVGAVRAGRQVLRVRRHGWVVADCSSVAEVAQHVDLADLCEVIELPARPEAEGIARAGTSSHHR